MKRKDLNIRPKGKWSVMSDLAVSLRMEACAKVHAKGTICLSKGLIGSWQTQLI